MLSVIIPVYNVETYLARCIDSLSKQLDDTDEMIIVDDGSTDASGQIAEELAADDMRIQIYHKENGGLSSARNYGLTKADGDFVTFVDSDDFVCDDYVAVIKSHLTEETDVLGFGVYKVQNGQVIGYYYSNIPEGVYCKDAIITSILPEAICKRGIIGTQAIQGSACAYAYRRAFLLGNGLLFCSERDIVNEDYLFNLNVLLKAGKMFFLQCALYCYDTRIGSLSHTYHPNIYTTKKALYHCYEKALMDAGLLDEMQEPLKRFWILCIYECIIDSVWKYSPLSPKEQIQKVDGFLCDNRLQAIIREYSFAALGPKGKLLIFLMRHHATCWICKGHRAFEKLKDTGMSIRERVKCAATISPPAKEIS